MRTRVFLDCTNAATRKYKKAQESIKLQQGHGVLIGLGWETHPTVSVVVLLLTSSLLKLTLCPLVLLLDLSLVVRNKMVKVSR